MNSVPRRISILKSVQLIAAQLLDFIPRTSTHLDYPIPEVLPHPQQLIRFRKRLIQSAQILVIRPPRGFSTVHAYGLPRAPVHGQEAPRMLVTVPEGQTNSGEVT